MSGPRLLIVGCGSIGRRHLRNLRALGVTDLLVFDIRTDRMASAAAECGASVAHSPMEAYNWRPDAVFVCTPPHLHLSHAGEAVAAGCHLFVEKPLADRLDGVDELLAEAECRGRILAVGYNWRFHPGPARLKQMLDQGLIGESLSIRAEFGQYLPDWRPAEDYRTTYTARASEGGGIILDASHELDMIRWLGGEVQSVWCAAGKVSGLEMDAEDTAEITLRMRRGFFAQVHVDCVQRGYTRTCKVTGTEGTLVWDAAFGVRHYDAKAKVWHEEPIGVEPNSIYFEEMAHFLACLRGEARVLVDGAAGRAALAIAMAAKRSAVERREVGL